MHVLWFKRVSRSICTFVFLFPILGISAGTGGMLKLSAAEGLAVKLPMRPDAVRFQDEILPLLSGSCTACHNQKIHEGGLILDSVKAILTGGDSGPSVVPGKPVESLVYLRASHRLEDFMPPTDNKVGAKNLSAEQLGLLEQWIQEGATVGPKIERKPIAWKSLPLGSGGVLTVAMSNEGRLTAAARGGRISLYNTSSAELLATLIDPSMVAADMPVPDTSHRDPVASLAIAPSGDLVASGSFRTIKLWKKIPPARLLELADTAAATAIDSTAIDTLTVTGLTDGRLILSDRSKGTVVRTINAHKAAVTDVEFSLDGATIFSSSRDGSLRAWKTADGTPAGELIRTGEVHSLALVSGGAQLASAESDFVIRVWSLPLPPAPVEGIAPPVVMPLKELKGSTQAVVSLTEMPAVAGQLVSAGVDGVVRLWSIETAAVLKQFAHGGAVTGLSIRADATRLASVGTVPGIKLWDIASGQLVLESKGDIRIADRLKSADIALILAKENVEYSKAQVAAAEKAVLTAAEEIKKTSEAMAAAEKAMAEKTEAVKAPTLAKSEAEKAAAQSTAAMPVAVEAHAAAVKSAAAIVAALEGATASVAAATKTVEVSPGDAGALETLKAFQAAAAAATVAKTATDETVKQATAHVERSKVKLDETTKKLAEAVKAFDAAEQARKQAETGLASAKRAVEFAQQASKQADLQVPLQKTLQTQVDATLVAQDATQKQVTQENTASEKPLLTVAFSQDGSLLVASGTDGRAYLFGGTDAKPRGIIDGIGDGRTLIDAPSAKQILVAGGPALAGIWNAASVWSLERTIGGEQTPPTDEDIADGPPVDIVTALAFSPDGKLLASGGGHSSRSGEIKLWNTADGVFVRGITTPHSDTVTSLEFSYAGDMLASCGTDRFVKVHKVADATLVKAFEGHTGHVLGVSWQANGRRLASAGADKVIKIWDLVSGEQQRTIAGLTKEATAIRFLSPSEEVLAASGDPTVRIYNATSGGTVRQFEGAVDFVQSIAVDKAFLVAGSQDGKLRIWNTATGVIVHTIEPSAAPSK